VKILITGGSGFLGSALARHLVQDGNQISLILRPKSRLDRLIDLETHFNIARCATDAEVEAFVLSVHPDVVIHTACSYGREKQSPLKLSDSNVRYGLMIMQTLMNMRRAVTFINTGTVLESEVSPYALSKHQFSDWGNSIAKQTAGRIKFINVLLQHMYGPGDDSSKFTTYVLHACLRNDLELKLTAGEQRRDFIYIDDVVSAYSVLINRRDQIESGCDIEVGYGKAPTIREFVEKVHRLTVSCTQLCFGSVPYRENEAMHCQADILKMSQLGWVPKYDIDAGLKKTLEIESSRSSVV